MTDADTLRAQMAASTDPARLEREAMRAQLVVMPEAPDGATLDAIGHKLYPYARGLGEFERRMARQIYTHVREALSEPRMVKVTAWAWVGGGDVNCITTDPERVANWRADISRAGISSTDRIVELTGEYEVRLARVGRGHEDECGRDVPSGLGGSGGAGAVETVVNEAAKLDAPATIGGPQDPSERAP